MLGFGAFLKGSHARARPIHVRGIPCGVIQHKATPGDTGEGWKGSSKAAVPWAARAGGSADPREGTAGDRQHRQPCPWLWQ